MCAAGKDHVNLKPWFPADTSFQSSEVIIRVRTHINRWGVKPGFFQERKKQEQKTNFTVNFIKVLRGDQSFIFFPIQFLRHVHFDIF